MTSGPECLSFRTLGDAGSRTSTISDYDSRVLTESRARADFFEATVALGAGETSPRAKTVANWVNGEFARLLNADALEIKDSRVTPEGLSQLLDLIASEAISGSTAKDV